MAKEYTIDATGKTIGHLASQIAVLLRDKNKTDFVPYKNNGVLITVNNIKNVVFKGKKLRQKKYYRHSGYLGHLKSITLDKVFEKDPGKVLKKAVWGMLPRNKLRSKAIKRLKIV